MDNSLISLAQDTVDKNDVDKLIAWLQTYPRLTKGPVTTEFELKWAKKFGSKYAVYVNSGSSANLMMLYALIVSQKLKNKKILVPALSWATDLAPVIQLGLEPVLVDCNMDDLSVDISHLQIMIAKHQPAALLLVSVLGFSPNMDEIVRVCNETGVILLEDNCESLGTTYNNTLLGNFGLMSSFSLYFGHHLSCAPDTPICYLNDRNIFSIDCIESIFEKYNNDLSKIKVVSFDPNTFELEYVVPHKMIKHLRGEKDIYRITTDNNRQVEITEDHSVFCKNGKMPIVKRGDELTLNDKILIPKSIPSPNRIDEINLIDYYRSNKNVFVSNFNVEDIRNKKFYWKSKEQKSKENYLRRNRMPIDYLKNLANNLKIGFRRQQGKNYIPYRITIDSDFSRLIGYFVAEGSYKNKNSLNFSFNSNETDYIEDVKNIIYRKFGLNTYITNQNNSCTISVDCKILQDIFENLLGIKRGALQKRVPNIVFHFSDKNKAAFLYAYNAGDGCYSNGRLSFSSVSKEAINDISYLCNMLQLKGGLHFEKGKYKVINNKKTTSKGLYTYRLNNIIIDKEGNISVVNKHKKCAYDFGFEKHIKKQVLFEKTNSLEKNLSFIKIRKIEKVEPTYDYVYDFCVLGKENFIGGIQPVFLHNSTIEGGVITTNDEYMNDILRIIRNHGWDRDLSSQKQQSYRNAYGIDEFNALYTFYHPGFNFRATDLQAYLGLGQLDKMDDLIIVRNNNFNLYNELLQNPYWKVRPQENSFTSNFCYPVLHPKRAEIVQALRDNNIEVRPLIAGSMGKQPMYTDRYGALELANVSRVDKHGFYVPNHQAMTEDDVRRVCHIINQVINS